MKSITYLRHPIGRGQLWGDAEVSLSAYLSKDSKAVENSKIRDSEIREGSVISGNARIFGGKVYRSFIGKDTVVCGNPEVRNSVLMCASVTGSPYLLHVVASGISEVSDNVVIAGKSILEPITLTGAALVYGNTQLRGSFNLHSQMRVSGGTWTRAPHYIDLGYASITESKLGCMVDCRDRTFEYWEKHGGKFGGRFGFSGPEIKEILAAIQEIKRLVSNSGPC